jgi:hypothetical protein
MKGMAFHSSTSDGFVVDRVRDDIIEARFVERVELTEVLVDPFGGETRYDRVEFRQCEFVVTAGPIGLELINPPRGTSLFVSRLSEICNFEIAIVSPSINLLFWAERLQNALDIRDTVFDFTRDRPFKLEKLQLRFNDRARTKVLIASVGTASIQTTEELPIVAALRRSLSEIIQRSSTV